MEISNLWFDPENIASKEIVVCLFDGDYHLGFAALVNSLVKADFNGLIHAGYRGDLPTWLNQLKLVASNLYQITNEITIQFSQVDTDMHLGYYKPFFIKETFNHYNTTNKLYYFDVDIVVNSSWKFYSKWLDKGLCLCLDNSFHFLHNTHPWRKQWRKLAPDDHLCFNSTNYYFNSGFLGIERGSISIIDGWIYYTKKYIEMGGNIKRFVKDDYDSMKGDQDLLNAAITIAPDIEISIMGQEGMGFTLPATIMVHAIGDIKPWNNWFLKHLIKAGHKPSFADKSFFLYCKYPIDVFPHYKYLMKRFDMIISCFLGRILG